jgi:hypothetical protein
MNDPLRPDPFSLSLFLPREEDEGSMNEQAQREVLFGILLNTSCAMGVRICIDNEFQNL